MVVQRPSIQNWRPLPGVKFSYSRLDSIVFNSKITTTYQESLIETKSQYRHNIYPGKPLRGIKPSKKILCTRCIKDNPRNSCSPPFVQSLSFSYALHKWVSLCVQIRTIAPLFILIVNWIFSLDKSAPLNSLGWIYVGILKTVYYIINWGTKDPTQEEALPHDSMMTKYNSNTPSEE